MIQVLFRCPEAMGEKDIRIIDVLPELQHHTSFEATDRGFAFFKKKEKILPAFRPEAHLYNAFDHSKNILTEL